MFVKEEEDNQVHGLFPTPVLRTNIKRDFTDEEIKYFRSGANQVVHNIGNHFTKNTTVLKDKLLLDVHKFCLKKLGDYMRIVHKPIGNLQIYITQSWINYTSLNEFHHQHAHPNSFLSGVLYLHSESERDEITFHRDKHRYLRVNTESNDELNADSWYFKVNTGDLFIFPSDLQHSVTQIKDDNEKNKTRISLAFNTFLSGELGEIDGLTKLTI